MVAFGLVSSFVLKATSAACHERGRFLSVNMGVHLGHRGRGPDQALWFLIKDHTRRKGTL